MPCNKPYTAYRSKNGKSKTGKHPIVFKKEHGIPGSQIEVPCGQCIGCRLEHSRVWAIRNVHESKMHEHNQYITLTYNNENLPSDNSLHKSDLQKFWKRLRKRGHNVRYYACGEYGDDTERPHYHAIVFGLELPDKELYSTSNGNRLYTSQTLERVWSHGHVIIGNVTFESCAYVSRYILKKWKGKTDYEIKKHYERINKETGLITQLLPEFQTMSRNPGIGKTFYEKYKNDFYQIGSDGRVTLRGGIQMSTPHYYDNQFENESTENFTRMEHIKQTRREIANDPERQLTQAQRNTKENSLRNRAAKQLQRKLN